VAIKLVSMAPLNEAVLTAMMKGAGLSLQDEIEIVNVNSLPDDKIIEEVKYADIILGDFTFNKKITREIALAAGHARLIQQPTVGYQHIDIDACTEAGIRVANTAGANTIGVAEHTVMAGLCLMKKTVAAHLSTRAGEWKQLEIGPGEIYGKTWGLVGMGRIGKAVAERLIPFGVRVLYHDAVRLSDDDESRYRAAMVTCDDLLKSSDIISLHCPLTDETRGLISRERIAAMKPGALIINVARGEIIDETALAEALRDRQIGGAALDVYTEEPLKKDSPLLSVDANLLLTPHIAGATTESKIRIIGAAIGKIVKVLNGEKPDFIINNV